LAGLGFFIFHQIFFCIFQLCRLFLKKSIVAYCFNIEPDVWWKKRLVDAKDSFFVSVEEYGLTLILSLDFDQQSELKRLKQFVQGKSQSERVRDAVDKKVRGVVDGTKQTLNKWKGEVRNINYVLWYHLSENGKSSPGRSLKFNYSHMQSDSKSDCE
jgi:hypothetical protein